VQRARIHDHTEDVDTRTPWGVVCTLSVWACVPAVGEEVHGGEYDHFFALILGFMLAINVEAQADCVDELSSYFYLFTCPPFPFSFFSRTKADNSLAGSPWSVGILNVHPPQPVHVSQLGLCHPACGGRSLGDESVSVDGVVILVVVLAYNLEISNSRSQLDCSTRFLVYVDLESRMRPL